MRDVKFRGKSIDEWVYGMLCKVNEDDTEHGEPIKYKIQTDEKEYGEYVQCFITDENTIGQYTGLKDIHGVKIYEGDIILTQPLKDKPFSRKARSKRLRGIVKYQVLCGQNFIGEPDEVKYWGAEWGIEIIDKKDYEKYNNYGWGLFFECEVIGNIYDNPELLGGK